ncbi:MAG: terminase large subunit [Rhodobacteraceae bacterium]|nr:terminase large subunit [Paracoccaceae bacterium]
MSNYTAVAEKYARDVISGEILAGKYIKLACQRHLDDLAWQDDGEFAFRFDAEAADKACKFIELMPHTKGKWAQKKLTLILEPWQVFMTVCLFGWLRKKDGKRRFRRFLLLVPRKNGKSAWAAAVGLYMLCADGEYGAEVYSGAKNEKQAWEVFKPARLMAQKLPLLCSFYGVEVNASNISIIENGSKFEPIIGDPGDGASPSLAIVDEYHEHETNKLFDTMETGMGARDQPLMLVITTAGDNIAGPCYEMQQDAQKMLEGSRQDDELLAIIYGIDDGEDGDDWTDPTILRKANPNMGVSVGEDFLLARLRDAMKTPRKAGVFKTKHLNMWVQSRAAYFNVLKFSAAADKSLKIEQFEGQECIIGVDLAEKKDLTAIEYTFRHGEGYACFGKYYAPEETIELPENEHLRVWRDMGLLVQIDGAVIDQRIILADIEDDLGRFDVREVSFDPWRSRQMAVELIELGAECIEFRGSPSNMNEPMREMDALIAAGNLHHDGNPAFTWMLSNVVNGTRTGDMHRPAKEHVDKKIDGPVARMLALGRWMLDDNAGAKVDDYFASL